MHFVALCYIWRVLKRNAKVHKKGVTLKQNVLKNKSGHSKLIWNDRY